MELYSFEYQTLCECEYIDGKYCLHTVYHVDAKDFDAVLRSDHNNYFLRPQDWVFDQLEAKHPGINDWNVCVVRHAIDLDFEDYEYYEIAVIEDI